MQQQSIRDNTHLGARWKTLHVSPLGAVVLTGDRYHLYPENCAGEWRPTGTHADLGGAYHRCGAHPRGPARPGPAPPSADLRRILERPHAATARGALPPAPALPGGRLGLAAGLRLPRLLPRASGSGWVGRGAPERGGPGSAPPSVRVRLVGRAARAGALPPDSRAGPEWRTQARGAPGNEDAPSLSSTPPPPPQCGSPRPPLLWQIDIDLRASLGSLVVGDLACGPDSALASICLRATVLSFPKWRKAVCALPRSQGDCRIGAACMETGSQPGSL